MQSAGCRCRVQGAGCKVQGAGAHTICVRRNKYWLMKMKNIWASITVVAFLGLMSCGKGEQRSAGDPADSLVNDSVPPSGENEYQSDLEPQTELDTIPDSTGQKP